MPHASSRTPQVLVSDSRFDDSPFVTDLDPVLDADENGSRVRARRLLPVTSKEIITAWTSAPAWERWMRLRSRSRATIAPWQGGALRLEVAEGPTIHVITGEVIEVSTTRVALSWCNHGASERSSAITVSIRQREHGTEMLFVHDHIANRREAAWLMRFWPAALTRLTEHLSGFATARRRRAARAATMPGVADAYPPTQRPSTLARSA